MKKETWDIGNTIHFMNHQNNKLFVYGTLQDHDVLALVLNRDVKDLTFEPFTLDDFSVLYVKNESFPMLVSKTGEAAVGVIIGNLFEKDLLRLDYFEGEEYQRMDLGTFSYYCPSEKIESDGRKWKFSNFLIDKPAYLLKVKKYMKNFGTGLEGEWD